MDLFRKNCSGYSSIAVIGAVILCFLFMSDKGATAAVCWLAVVFCVSYFMHPFMMTRNLRFPDAGFGLSFGTGLFLCFFTAWTFCAVTGCEFADAAVYGSTLILFIAGYAIKKFILKEPYQCKDDLKKQLNGFAVFAVIFLVFFWVIGFNPVIDNGTENYMDFGFMQTIYRQKSAIPIDPWFSGTKLNYYYLGQSASVFMCRLAHTTPEYGYNMMLCTFIGMVFLMVYELAAAVADRLLPQFQQKDKCMKYGGIFAGSVAAFAANPHWLLFGILGPVLSKFLGNDDYRYWFSDGTVYINTDAGDPDNGKNEFPAYSVILGDLHAHVINLIFVLPLLSMLFDLCLSEEEDRSKKTVIYRLVLISMLLGYYKGANYWDFAIYFVITGAVIVFTDFKRRGISLKTTAVIVSKAVLVTLVSIVAILPFTLNFVKMESGIRLCDNHTSPAKFAVLWLIPVLVTVSLICFLYSKRRAELNTGKTARAGFLAFMLCTIGLIITPEIVYVLDIYGETNSRFNTMFKLTYQAFTLFALITGVAFAACLFRVYTETQRTKFFAITFIVFAALSVSYTPYAAHQWFGDFWKGERRVGISSIEGLYRNEFYAFEMEAYDILMEDDKKVLNIVEVAGDSYRHESSLSVYTGACTPLGWYVHEWMWHNDSEPVHERADSIRHFYGCGDEEYCKHFIQLYDIDYILVGPAEVCKYYVNRNGFWNLGEPVADTIWQDVELALIKIDRSRL